MSRARCSTPRRSILLVLTRTHDPAPPLPTPLRSHAPRSADVVPIITSTVMECYKAGLRKSALEWACFLMQPEQRPNIDPKFFKSIENIVRSAHPLSVRMSAPGVCLKQRSDCCMNSPHRKANNTVPSRPTRSCVRWLGANHTMSVACVMTKQWVSLHEVVSHIRFTFGLAASMPSPRSSPSPPGRATRLRRTSR